MWASVYIGVHKNQFEVYSKLTVKSKIVFWTKTVLFYVIFLFCLKRVYTHLNIVKVKITILII